MASCKDCLHVEICEDFTRYKFSPSKAEEIIPILRERGNTCKDFKGRSRFVELPCNVGDTVYIALNGYGVLKDTVKEFRVTSRRIWIRPEKFGMDCLLENMAFLSREEAEQTLKERESNA